jgi:hypothetical protein
MTKSFANQREDWQITGLFNKLLGEKTASGLFDKEYWKRNNFFR